MYNKVFLFNFLQNICDALAPVAVTIAAVAAKEIEQLKQTLQEKDTLLLAMEATCLTESERQAELEDSVIAWQDKYDRLYESHKRVQKVNQSLEDKLLKLVDRNTGERAQLTSDVATLSVRLAQANFNISKLQRDIVSTAFRFLFNFIFNFCSKTVFFLLNFKIKISNDGSLLSRD